VPAIARSPRRTRTPAAPAPASGGLRAVRAASSATGSERGARTAPARSSVLDLLDLLGRRWALRILWELSANPLRFTEIQDRCDAMSPSVLNQRLAELVRAGLVQARVDRRYGLTSDGSDLVSCMKPLDPWARRWGRRAVRSRG